MSKEKPSIEPPDPQKLLKRLRRMHFMSQELQAKMEDMEVQGDSGDGLVKVEMDGMGKVIGLKIHETLVNVDSEFLESLLLNALNSAIEAREAAIQAETMKMAKERGLHEDKFE